jgi:hypothetical protein
MIKNRGRRCGWPKPPDTVITAAEHDKKIQ